MQGEEPANETMRKYRLYTIQGKPLFRANARQRVENVLYIFRISVSPLFFRLSSS